MDDENPLRYWARQLLIGIGLFLTGAVLAFGYSYRPLHGALSWKVDQLEARLDDRNRENAQLHDQLAALESKDESRIDPETLAQVKRELEQTQRALAQTEKNLDRIDHQWKEASSSAATWRQRFEELHDAPAAAPRITENRRGLEPFDPSMLPNSTPRAASPATSPPASPAASADELDPTPSAQGSRAAMERGMFVPDESVTTAP